MKTKDLIDLMNNNEIEDYSVKNKEKEVRLSSIEDFDKFIYKYHVEAFRIDHGHYSPYGWNDEVFTEYKGWKITSNLRYHK